MNPSSINFAFQKCREERRPALLTYTVSGDPSKKISLDKFGFRRLSKSKGL